MIVRLQSKLREKLGAMALACVAGLGLTGPADGQFGEAAGIAEAMQKEYYSRDVKLFQEGLQLDEAQRVIVEALYRDYDTAFESGIERVRQRIEEMRSDLSENDPKRVMKMIFAPFAEWGGEKLKLEEQFLENVRVVLTEEQMALWPKFERSLYRDKKLRRGLIAGESLNLFNILRDLHLDEQTTANIQSVVDEYDVALDQALRQRQRAISGPDNKMAQYLADDSADDRMAEFERQMKLRLAVRSVNDTYTEQIAAALPAELGAQFKQLALEQAYPRVYRPTPVQRIFTDAKAIEGLEEGLRLAVEQLERNYITELDGQNRHILQVFRQHEPKEQIERAGTFAARSQGQHVENKPVDPTRELFAKRDDLSRSYARQLQAILTPEQFATLSGAARWVEDPVQPTAKVERPTRRSRAEPVQSKGSGGINISE